MSWIVKLKYLECLVGGRNCGEIPSVDSEVYWKKNTIYKFKYGRKQGNCKIVHTYVAGNQGGTYYGFGIEVGIFIVR